RTKHFLNGIVGFAVVRRRCDSDFERTILLAHNSGATRSGLGAHGQDAPFRVADDLDHRAIPSNKTVPRRTKVAPSSMATSKSLLMPIDKCRRSCGCVSRSRN